MKFALISFQYLVLLDLKQWPFIAHFPGENETLFITIMKDQYLKKWRVIYASNTTAKNAENWVLRQCLAPHNIPNHLPTENQLHFASSLFKTSWRVLGLKNLRAATYHSKTSRQLKTFIKPIVTRFRATSLSTRICGTYSSICWHSRISNKLIETQVLPHSVWFCRDTGRNLHLNVRLQIRRTYPAAYHVAYFKTVF